MSRQFIVVEGAIGVGKTSLARKLAETLSLRWWKSGAIRSDDVQSAKDLTS